MRKIIKFLKSITRHFYEGRSNFFFYTFVGFTVSILLGLSAGRIYGRLEPFFSYGQEYSPRVTVYGGLAFIFGFLTFIFLVFISVSVWRYFKSRRGFKGWVMLLLGILHVPVSLLTILIDATQFFDALVMTLSYFQII